jgi:hypothetical protein
LAGKLFTPTHFKEHGTFKLQTSGWNTILLENCKRTAKTFLCRNYYGVHVSDSSKNKSLTAGAVTQLAELAQTFLDGGFNEIVFVACDLMKQRDMIISNEDLLNVHSFLALLHFFVSFVSLGVDGNLMDISESCTLSNLFDKHVFYWLKRTWELFDQNKVCKLCMLLVHISFTETFEKGCARVALRVCSRQGNACFHGENNCAGFTSG